MTKSNKNNVVERWSGAGYKQSFRDIVGLMSSKFYEIIAECIPKMPKNAKVADIGCAGGKWGAMFAFIGCDVTLIDINKFMLHRAKTNYPYINMKFICDDARTLKKLPNEHYNIIVSDGLIEHFLDQKERIHTVQCMMKKLTNNGVMFFTVPEKSKHDDEHYYESPKEIFNEFFPNLEKCRAFNVYRVGIKSKVNPNWFMVALQKGVLDIESPESEE